MCVCVCVCESLSLSLLRANPLSVLSCLERVCLCVTDGLQNEIGKCSGWYCSVCDCTVSQRTFRFLLSFFSLFCFCFVFSMSATLTCDQYARVSVALARCGSPRVCFLCLCRPVTPRRVWHAFLCSTTYPRHIHRPHQSWSRYLETDLGLQRHPKTKRGLVLVSR